jgi:N-acyl-phosphatidylethanolamine-hydrolysing phospholipase D
MIDFGTISSKLFLIRYVRIPFCIAIAIAISACASPDRRVIVNPYLNPWDDNRGGYVNLFEPAYGYLEESAFDKIDYRKPHEIGERKYLFYHDPRGDIDRTKGYDPAEYTVSPDYELLRNPAHEVQITWVGHATFLIQLGGKYQILVDPVFERIDGIAGYVTNLLKPWGVHAKPALSVSDLPFGKNAEGNPDDLKIVAISHDHLDHLNFRTLKQLPLDTLYYVPRGLEKKFSSRYQHVTAMDWYTQDTLGELTIHFLPANHRSGRAQTRKGAQSLWGGWLFEWKNHSVFFAGDSGYSDVFKDMGKRYGNFDTCLMPIGAYFQRQWHFTPEDALQAAEDLGCSTIIPMHWGTWVMSFEHILEPPRRLQYAFEIKNPENIELRILKMGGTFILDSNALGQ